MSKRLYSAMTAAALLALTACTAEDPFGPSAGDGTVIFTVTAPGSLGSRADGDAATEAFGNGQTAKNLTYYLYQLDENMENPQYIGDGFATMENLKKQVTMKLVTGKNYGVVWLAQSGSTYNYNTDNHTISVNYDNLEQNLETRDAFYQYTTLTVTGADQKPVELYRPFAQVNFGTSDMNPKDELAMGILAKAFGETTADGKKLPNLRTKLEVTTSVPTVLNLMDGTVSEEEQVKVKFNATGVPEDQDFPYQPKDAAGQPAPTYDYLAMDYLLAPKEGDVMDFEFSVLNNETEYNKIKVSSAPVKANYRTNIFGQLLTSTVDFDVVIEPLFTLPDYNDSNYAFVSDETTFANAIADKNVKNIELAKDIELKSVRELLYWISAARKIDLAGHTLTIASDEANPKDERPRFVLYPHPGANFVIENGTIESDAIVPIQIPWTNVSFNNVKINLNNDDARTAITVFGSSLNLKDVIFNTNGSGFILYHDIPQGTTNEFISNLNADNCKFYQNSDCVVGVGNSDNPIITSYALKADMMNRGCVILKNCDMSSYVGVLSLNGGETLTIDGGTYANFLSETTDINKEWYRHLGSVDSENISIVNAKFYTEAKAFTISKGATEGKISFENVLTKDTSSDNNFSFFYYTGKPQFQSNTFATDASESATIVMPDGKTTKNVVFDKKIDSYKFPAVTE